ncbi:MAG: ribosomal RNA small subunit methyltransferase A [Bacteroidetes bacterium]|nr:ribosomal RNA small subunit methyltransferase A [Bacteroidota bacterium]
MRENNLSFSKRFGQNFLISPASRNKIIDALEINDYTRNIWEIGPGIGAMTHMLLNRDAKISVFEIDYGFCRILNTLFGENDNFRLITGDFLKNWIGYQEESGTPDRIMGNLPYNVGSVMIANLIEKQCTPDVMVFTLQREVAMRITAVPGSKNYSSFTLLCGMDYETKKLGDLNPGNFYPKPDVVSSIIKFVKRSQPSVPDEYRVQFMEFVRDIFRSRRKTIKNNLLNGCFGKTHGKEVTQELLEVSSLNSNERGENLTAESILNFLVFVRNQLT